MSGDGSIEEIREQKRAEMLSGTEGGGAAESAAAPDEPIHVEGADHLREVADSYGVVLVDFYADWCGPCEMIEPIVAEIAAETDAAVAKVDIDRHQRLASENGVRGVPTLVLYSGGQPAERLVGVQDKDTLVDLVRQYGG